MTRRFAAKIQAALTRMKVIRIEKNAARIEWSKVEAAAGWETRGISNLADGKGVPYRFALELSF
jgi:hypothetical protein